MIKRRMKKRSVFNKLTDGHTGVVQGSTAGPAFRGCSTMIWSRTAELLKLPRSCTSPRPNTAEGASHIADWVPLSVAPHPAHSTMCPMLPQGSALAICWHGAICDTWYSMGHCAVCLPCCTACQAPPSLYHAGTLCEVPRCPPCCLASESAHGLCCLALHPGVGIGIETQRREWEPGGAAAVTGIKS